MIQPTTRHAHPLFDLEARIARRWQARIDRRIRQQAVERALAEFAVEQPRWSASLFDAEFLAKPAARAAVDDLDAASLAKAWSEQFPTTGGQRSEREVKRLLPVTTSFLARVTRIRNELYAAR